ncbi:hypothetical protein PENSPDRAFT_756559, partial [Peniophora sp. CONT]
MLETASSIEKNPQAAEHAWLSFLDARLESLPENGSPSALRDAADAELEGIRKCLAAVGRRRNAILGVCKLHPELLSEIFSIVRASWTPMRAKAKALPCYSPGWMVVTHLCSRWRQVAVADPSLWNAIDCLNMHPLSMHTILSRCQNLPLKLTLFIRLPALDEHATQAFTNWLSAPVCSRADSLNIHLDFPSIIGMLPTHLPNIENLSISLGIDGGVASADILASRFSSKLSRLSLSGYHRTTWASPIFFPSITHLQWQNMERSAGSLSLPVSDVPAFLARMPNLRSLSLLDVLDMPSDDKEPQPFALPSHIDCIIIEGTYNSPETAALFKGLSIPAKTSMSVLLEECDDSELARQVVASMFQGLYADASELRELGLEDRRLFMRPWRSEPPESDLLDYMFDASNSGDENHHGHRAFSVSDFVGSSDLSSAPAEDAGLYIPYLPLSSVAALTIGDDLSCITSHAAWIYYFASARNVRHLYMAISLQAASLCAALEKFTDSSFTLFPNLETVTLGFRGYDWEQDIQQSLVPALVSMLGARRGGGTAVREVRAAREAESCPWLGVSDAWIGVRELVQLSFFD